MVSLHLIFHAYLELLFPDVETNPSPQRPVPAEYSPVIKRDSPGTRT